MGKMLTEHVDFQMMGRVYVRGDADTIAYSDGTATERYLKTVLENASDLSSHSVELERAIQDWPTEYHLSSRRANLFRGFDFEPRAKVLELGCGCGAISRYLGEQGLDVDAVEGSYERAELAALRCRDLDNVTVCCANFNHLDLPQGAYDLICLVGVAEYAARFMDTLDGGEEPVVRLLTNLKKALKPGGAIALAIENRTGMKYVFGAHEDHYARRFVGINNYFGVKDINTYTLVEWEEIFRQTGVENSQVYLPFPDYKLPTVILSREFSENNPNAFCNLEGIQSRDYVDVFKPEIRESLFWQSAAASRSLARYANSFLFFLDMTGAGIEDWRSFDFAHLPGFSRRRDCCLVTIKPQGEDLVRRHRIVDQHLVDPFVEQKVIDEPYRNGTLLSVMWSRAIQIEPDSERFTKLVGVYLDFVRDSEERTIDLIPSNIVVDDNEGYLPFDQEWITAEPVTEAFLLFRALLVFVSTSGASIRGYALANDIVTVREFIEFVGESVGVTLSANIDEHVEREERFQNAIAVDRPGNLTWSLLERSVREDPRHVAPVRMRLYWAKAGQPYCEEDSRFVMVDNSDDKQMVRMLLPPAAGLADRIRFNPLEVLRDDGVGFMRIYAMRISAVNVDGGDATTIWSLTGPDQIAEHADMTGIRYESSSLGSVFMVTSDDPALEFRFIPREKPGNDQALEVEVELRVARSSEYLLARDRYVTTQERLDARLEELDDLEASYRRVRAELTAIKQSNFWRQFERYRGARSRVDALTGRLRVWTALSRNLGWKRTAARAYRQGAKRIQAAVGRKPEVEGPPTRYEVWRDLHLPRAGRAPSNGPLISVVMPVHEAPGNVLAKAVESVRKQSYRNWELCIADDASANPDTRAVLGSLNDSRIKVVRLSENKNISGATNAAADLARGEYLAFMDNDDEVADDALCEVAQTIVETGADCLYTDEDFIKTDGHLDYPHFKPEFNPDLLLSHNYITHLMVLRRKLFDEIGGLRSEYDGAQDYDLLLRAVERTGKVVHIPKPLYHWRMSEQSTSLNPTVKPGGHQNAKAALEAALRRRQIAGSVEETSLPHYFRIRRAIAGSPRVSIIIPFRDKPELLRRCITTILEKTTFPRFELIGLSNDSCSSLTYDTMRELQGLDSRIRFHEVNEDFNFSRLVNFGVDAASGDHVLLLNNDIEIINEDWIESLLEHSQRDEVAAVGGKLYYPNNTVQHAGIAIGLGGYAGHPHQGFRADAPGYFNRLNVIQNVTAVTGALMMVEKRKYAQIGRFDEDNFQIAYNDVDFCLRAIEHGFVNVFTPYVEAYHRESASRGYEDTPSKAARFDTEKQNLLKRHGPAIDMGDPYYSPNFDQDRADFRFFVEPAAGAKI